MEIVYALNLKKIKLKKLIDTYIAIDMVIPPVQ